MKPILRFITSELLIAFAVFLFAWAMLCFLYIFREEQPLLNWFVAFYLIRVLVGAYMFRTRGHFVPTKGYTYLQIIASGFLSIGTLMLPVMVFRYWYFNKNFLGASFEELFFYFGSTVFAFSAAVFCYWFATRESNLEIQEAEQDA